MAGLEGPVQEEDFERGVVLAVSEKRWHDGGVWVAGRRGARRGLEVRDADRVAGEQLQDPPLREQDPRPGCTEERDESEQLHQEEEKGKRSTAGQEGALVIGQEEGWMGYLRRRRS